MSIAQYYHDAESGASLQILQKLFDFFQCFFVPEEAAFDAFYCLGEGPFGAFL